MKYRLINSSGDYICYQRTKKKRYKNASGEPTTYLFWIRYHDQGYLN